MEGDNNLQSVIGALHEQAQEISRRRRQQVQEDEASLKRIIDRLNLHSCSGTRDLPPSWLGNEEIRHAYQKAREDRDEYKFQLNVCKNQIKDLKEELDAVRLNQTLHNISIVTDVAHSERKSCAYAVRLQPGDSSNKNDAKRELNATQSLSEETYQRELNYLHKTNEKCYEEIRKLKSELSSQEKLLKRLKDYEEEITNLKKITEDKEEKMMLMQIKFDERLKNTKRDYAAQISALNNRIKELETVRDALNIDLGAAQEEIRLLQLSVKKPVEETELSNYVEMPNTAVTDSQQIQKDTSQEQEELLNISSRRARRAQLQPIENIIEHEHSTYVRLSEQPLIDRQQVTVDKVTDLCPGVTRGTKRGQRGGKGLKKESAAAQKQEAKKVNLSVEKKAAPLQNRKNESTDTISPNTRKVARIPRKKATDSSTDTVTTINKQIKKLRTKQETDENVEPCPLECSSSSFNGSLAKIKMNEDNSTPVTKKLKKVQDDSRRVNRKRNK